MQQVQSAPTKFQPEAWTSSLDTDMYGMRFIMPSGLQVSFHVHLDKMPNPAQLLRAQWDLENLLDESRTLAQCSLFFQSLVKGVKERGGRCFYYGDRIPQESRMDVLLHPAFRKTMSIIGQSKTVVTH